MNGLYAAKPWFIRRLKKVEDLLVGWDVSADSLTAAALVVSLCCGLFLALGGILEEPVLWLLVPPLALVRLALNALDGSLARRRGTDRPFGEVINEMGDRLSDAALLGPLAFAGPAPLALIALVATLIASTAGLLGRALLGERISGGPMGKADRVAAISLAALAAGLWASPIPFEIALWVVLGGAVVTVAARLVAIRRRLEADSHVRF
jgi:CDP-diacylglycerol---glycerol-3-phosphate 3-phosphatidyltransferase